MKTIDIKPRIALLITFSILLTLYSIFQARFLILGPRIQITSPREGHPVENPLVMLEGRAQNVSWISLNDRQIFTDEKGKWSEKLIVSRGLSIMTLQARDRFGREIRKSLRIIYN